VAVYKWSLWVDEVDYLPRDVGPQAVVRPEVTAHRLRARARASEASAASGPPAWGPMGAASYR
jgi:hypothetical protein